MRQHSSNVVFTLGVAQQAATLPAQPTEAAIRQQALVDQQTILVKQLVGAETQLASVQSEFPGATGVDRQMLERQLAGGRARVAELRVQLAETRNQLNAIQVAAPAPQIGVVPHVDRVFGYTQT
jgi:multidrug resistance efflux pump